MSDERTIEEWKPTVNPWIMVIPVMSSPLREVPETVTVSTSIESATSDAVPVLDGTVSVIPKEEPTITAARSVQP